MEISGEIFEDFLILFDALIRAVRVVREIRAVRVVRGSTEQALMEKDLKPFFD